MSSGTPTGASGESLDRLVEEIRKRVVAELTQKTLKQTPGLHLPLREQPCTEGPSENCGACGLCTVRRPEAVRELADFGAVRVGSASGTGQAPDDIAGMIDHTLLKADATADDVRKLCDEARKYRFASVCVNTSFVPLCKRLLAGSGVMVCAVVGFPLGAMAANAKAFEAREAVRAGAQEIDMVINQGALKSKDYATVLDDIRKVVEASRPAHVKVILETGALTSEEKVIGISLSKVAGAHFVKTSTGFGPGGATAEDIALMRRLVGTELGVKASGGVRTCEDAQKMKASGASRIGASASVAIVAGCKAAAEGKADPAATKPAGKGFTPRSSAKPAGGSSSGTGSSGAKGGY